MIGFFMRDDDCANLTKLAQSPEISASFLARDQPLICCSLAIASCRAGISSAKTRRTGRRF